MRILFSYSLYPGMSTSPFVTVQLYAHDAHAFLYAVIGGVCGACIAMEIHIFGNGTWYPVMKCT
jgi:hypothetical protein